MARIRITDNHDWIEYGKCIVGDSELPANVLPDLQKIANNRLGDLKLDARPNLLVFPKDLYQYGDEIVEHQILSSRDDLIATGNVMGFVGVNETQIDIKSRFAKDDEQDCFLHYMLQKVFSINLFDIKHSTSQEPIFDFLLYLFPYFLKKALAQGLFKKYRKYEYNDANVKEDRLMSIVIFERISHLRGLLLI